MTNILSRLAKAGLIAYLFYVNWISQGLYDSALLLYGTVLLATVGIGCECIHTGKLILPRSRFITMLFLFSAYSFLSGLLIAANKSSFVSLMITFFANALVCYECWYVSLRERSMEWLAKTIICVSAAVMVQMVLFPYVNPITGRYSLGSQNNPNVLGSLLVSAIFFLVHEKKHLKQFFAGKVCLIAGMVFIIIQTGSRKSLLAAGMLIAIWIVSYCKSEVSRKMNLRTIGSLALLLIGVAAAGIYLLNNFESTEIFSRFESFFAGKDSHIRNDLYREAFETWLAHPLFGVGYSQFRYYSTSRHLAHSTYMEILSCTGIIGFLIFFIPIVRLGVELTKAAFKKKYAGCRYDSVMMLTMFAIELLVGAGQEWIYYPMHLNVLMYLSWKTERKNVADLQDDTRKIQEENQ